MPDIKYLFSDEVYKNIKEKREEYKKTLELLEYGIIDGYTGITQLLTDMPKGFGGLPKSKTCDLALERIEQEKENEKTKKFLKRKILEFTHDIKRVEYIIDKIKEPLLFTIFNEHIREDKPFSEIARLPEFEKEYMSESTIKSRYYRYVDKKEEEYETINDEIKKELII